MYLNVPDTIHTGDIHPRTIPTLIECLKVEFELDDKKLRESTHGTHNTRTGSTGRKRYNL